MWRHGALLLILPAAGCGAGPASDSAFEARDSAGVRVATSSAPLWTEDTAWRLSARPSLNIGEAMVGDSSVPFAAVAAVHVLASGAVAVYDPWAPGVFFFDAAGAYLGRGGRQGEGPGEFPARTMYGPESYACGTDSVYVRTGETFAVFTPPATHVRSFTPAERFLIAACQGDRILGLTPGGERRTTPGVHVDSVAVGWYDLDGEVLGQVDTIPWSENAYAAGPYGSVGYAPFPFGRTFALAATDSVLAASFGPSIRLEGSGPETLMRVSGAERVVGEEDVRRFRDFVANPMRGNPNGLRRVEERLGDAVGRPYPWVAELRFDAGGNLWARRYGHADAVSFYDDSGMMRGSQGAELEAAAYWLVFRPDGRWLGEVVMPADFTVHEIGEDRVLGVWKDEFDVPYVRRYGIVKPAG